MNELIIHSLNEHIVGQRPSDGYVNATAMCQAAGKLWADYARLKSTAEFLAELEVDMGIPITEQIQVVRGGFPEKQGTWVHPHVAVNLAQWCSARFAVQVSRWVYEWATTGQTPKQAQLPFHLRRYLANAGNLPFGHFSILSEMTITLIAPLEMSGYTLPEKMWPDISEGRMFASWLKNEHGITASELPTYPHVFEDGRRSVNARAYPEDVLPHFRKHLRDVWMPKRAISYFAERDPRALPYVRKLLPPPPKRPAVA